MRPDRRPGAAVALGTVTGYHALTFRYILEEVVSRVAFVRHSHRFTDFDPDRLDINESRRARSVRVLPL